MQSKSSAGSEDSGDPNAVKKPLIAKWKTGAKLQVTARAPNDESLLEGLKRAQRCRLEDQRGTEINTEIPEFLKDKEKYAGNKLRKTKIDESPSNAVSLFKNVDHSTTTLSPTHYTIKPPQPAPRLSLTNKSFTKSSPEVSSVQSKIHSLENSIMLGKVFPSPRMNEPNSSLNMVKKSSSGDSPFNNSAGVYAGEFFKKVDF